MGDTTQFYGILFAIIVGTTLSHMMASFSRKWDVLNGKYPSDVTVFGISGFWILAGGAIVSVVLLVYFSQEILKFQDRNAWNTFAVIAFASAPYFVTHAIGPILLQSEDAINKEIKIGRDIKIIVGFAVVYVISYYKTIK